MNVGPRALLGMLMALLLGCSQNSTSPTRQIALRPCMLKSPGLPVRLKARCGTLEVPEDRSAPSGKKLSLRLAVLKATSKKRQPDPLFYITGGPGQAATES